ncbi:MAG: glutamyl-tRNA reductase, partial [Cyclobacteriaceae bacterium]
MNQHFRFVGISHRDSPLDLREKLAFQEDNTKEFFKKLKEVHSISEAMIVSTCNRTEIYFSSVSPFEQEVVKLACIQKGLDYSEISPYLHMLNGTQAVEHLFKVSLGLDARVLGDIQIINQVKNAYQWS